MTENDSEFEEKAKQFGADTALLIGNLREFWQIYRGTNTREAAQIDVENNTFGAKLSLTRDDFWKHNIALHEAIRATKEKPKAKEDSQ